MKSGMRILGNQSFFLHRPRLPHRRPIRIHSSTRFSSSKRIRRQSSFFLKFLLFFFSTFFASGCAIKPKFINSIQESDFQTINSHRVYVWDRGEGISTTLLHGIPDHIHNQTRLIDGLQSFVRVLAYDRLGFGLSDKPRDLQYNISEQVESLHQLLQFNQAAPSVLIGHSYGGPVAVYHAAKYPQEVRALVLMNPTLILEKGHTGMMTAGGRFFTWPLVGEILGPFHSQAMTATRLKHTFYDRTRLTDEMVTNYHYPFTTPGAKSAFLKNLRNVFEDPEFDPKLMDQKIQKIREAKIPVLLIWTEKDPFMPVADAHNLATQLGAQLHLIANCGHLPQLELDDDRLQKDLLDPIQEFIGSLP